LSDLLLKFSVSTKIFTFDLSLQILLISAIMTSFLWCINRWWIVNKERFVVDYHSMWPWAKFSLNQFLELSQANLVQKILEKKKISHVHQSQIPSFKIFSFLVGHAFRLDYHLTLHFTQASQKYLILLRGLEHPKGKFYLSWQNQRV
jgi:hypothetical protein